MNLFLIYKKEFFSSRGFKDEEVFTFCLLRLAEHMVFLWKAAGWNLGKNVTVCGSVLFHPRFKETTHTHTHTIQKVTLYWCQVSMAAQTITSP